MPCHTLVIPDTQEVSSSRPAQVTWETLCLKKIKEVLGSPVGQGPLFMKSLQHVCEFLPLYAKRCVFACLSRVRGSLDGSKGVGLAEGWVRKLRWSAQ